MTYLELVRVDVSPADASAVFISTPKRRHRDTDAAVLGDTSPREPRR